MNKQKLALLTIAIDLLELPEQQRFLAVSLLLLPKEKLAAKAAAASAYLRDAKARVFVVSNLDPVSPGYVGATCIWGTDHGNAMSELERTQLQRGQVSVDARDAVDFLREIGSILSHAKNTTRSEDKQVQNDD